MDLILLIGIAVALLVILATLLFLRKKSDTEEVQEEPQQRGQARGVDRRAQIARNQRNRLRNNNEAPATQARQQEEDGEGPSHVAEVADEKMGAKKRAKLEAKAEKKAMRETELKLREDKKKKEALEDEERKKQSEKEAEDERKAEEAERLAKEEKERKEHEEYLKMKAAFSVEEEGFEEGEEDEKENMLADFIQYIKDSKVVVLEDLAIEFKLKTQQAIDRITELQENGTITGVIDDRGKFIYISEDELKSVAKFIKQRGRVSITELAENSATLINLVPVA